MLHSWRCQGTAGNGWCDFVFVISARTCLVFTVFGVWGMPKMLCGSLREWASEMEKGVGGWCRWPEPRHREPESVLYNFVGREMSERWGLRGLPSRSGHLYCGVSFNPPPDPQPARPQPPLQPQAPCACVKWTCLIIYDEAKNVDRALRIAGH